MHPLQNSSLNLAVDYDAVLLDLDGVVYLGADAIPGVIDCLNHAHDTHGLVLTCVTNNAARSSRVVAVHLQELGLHVEAEDVVTSAQAGAAELAQRLPGGARVFVLGSKDLIVEVENVGLVPSQETELEYEGLIQGYWPDMPWRMLGVAAQVIRSGALWVATNMDLTIPTSFGMSPGNGTMVNALAVATGRQPDVIAGKPEVPLMQQSINRAGAKRPLVVGDRLDTDIEGANRVGVDSLLVFSGVTTISELLVAPEFLRPTYIAWDATGISQAHSGVNDVESFNGWSISHGHIVGRGDSLDAVRIACVGVWTEALTADAAKADLTALGLAVH